MIDFESLPVSMLHEFRGGTGDIEAKIFGDELNRIVKSVYAPGVSTGFHAHEDSSEIIFILSGSCKVLHNDKTERISKGQCHYCKKGESHAVINDTEEDLVMYAVVCTQ